MITSAETQPTVQRVLIVEDETMIRMLLEDMLSELGYEITAQAGRIDEALDAAKNAEFDFAILDVDLNGQPSLSVADALAERGLPFVFATGYAENDLPPSHRNRPTLKKPFQIDGLRQTLATVLQSDKN